jgi:uncharacterized protein (TIGR00251 family)
MQNAKVMASYLQRTKDGVTLSVKVHPGARRNRVAGTFGDLLKIDVAAKPEGGVANKELISFLAKTLRIAKSRFSLVRGGASRKKVIGIADADIEILENKFSELLGKE